MDVKRGRPTVLREYTPVLCATVDSGASLTDALEDARDVARYWGLPVSFTFNNVPVLVQANSDLAVLRRWYDDAFVPSYGRRT